ncbi:MAG: ABC transporter permease, partial [Clostridium sp.]|nr:ABC transporter permease [Clostridium sp.]
NHQAVFKKMVDQLTDSNLSQSNLFNIASVVERNRALINVINIFSFGFIILISLIAAANVFNTISTNIHLRKREFAMLKTVGMTPKGFKKMMTYESVLYGLKGLLYGLPVAIGVTYLIYLAMSNGIDFEFFIPWYSLIIAIGSVFIVVFSTSAYGMNKIRQDNPIDALKSENT